MKRTVLIAIFSLIAVLSFAQSKEATVWSKAEALTKAIFETKDSMVLKELVSDRVSYGHSGGNVEDKKTMVTKAANSKTEYKNRSFEKLSMDADDKTAILRHNFRAISVENGKETPLDLSILQVWKKEGGKWKLWARQAVKIAPKS